MKILIDIGHPAHVHYFKNFIKIMSGREHQFLIVSRNRNVIFELLNQYEISFISRGKGSKSFLGKILYSFYSLYVILNASLKFKPNLFISQGGVYTSPIAWLLNKTSISTEDTENAVISHRISKLFKSFIISPSCFEKQFNEKHIKYNSYQELFYLHPEYFKPDISVYKDLKITSSDKYVILRFVDWNAHHDIGHSGISRENKIKAVEELSKYAKVFILSESQLPEELLSYKINIPSHKMHDALYYAELLFGESSTMASECACLGTPAIFIDNEGRGYTREEEKKYGIVFNFKETNADVKLSIKKAISLLKQNDLKKNFNKVKKRIILDKVNPTEFLVNFIENLPAISRQDSIKKSVEKLQDK